MAHSSISHSCRSWYSDKVTWQFSSTWINFIISVNPCISQLPWYRSNARRLQLRKTFSSLDRTWCLGFYINFKLFKLSFSQWTIAGLMLHDMDYVISMLLMRTFKLFWHIFSNSRPMFMGEMHAHKYIICIDDSYLKEPKFFFIEFFKEFSIVFGLRAVAISLHLFWRY